MGIGSKELTRIMSFSVLVKNVYLPPKIFYRSIMRKSLIIILFTMAHLAQAQFTEIGLFGGGSNFIGDVGNSNISIPNGWVAGLNFRHQFNNYYAIRVMGNMGTIQANDAESNWVSKQQRNLSFRSSIWEVGVLMEINFLEFVTGSKKMTHSPYIFGGLAIFGFNPQAQFIDGEYYDLQPLGTEGQGTSLNNKGKYGLAGISLPFGIGYRWSIGKNTSIALETGFRPTSTDYLDDASTYYVNNAALAQEAGAMAAYFADRSTSGTDKTNYPRANKDNNDWYVFTGFHLYFTLTPKNERCKRF